MTKLDDIQQATEGPCEMCGDTVTDGGSGRQHDTYDCAVSLRSRIAELEAALGRAEAENVAMVALLKWCGSPGAECLVAITEPEYPEENDETFEPWLALNDASVQTTARTAIDLATKLGLIAGGKTNG